MIRYIAKRLLMLIPVLLGIVLVVFIMNRISPGNPARMLLGDGATDEAVAALEEELGLNDPLYVQFFNYVKGVVTEFDLGTSYQTKRPVITELMDRFPTTAKLAFFSILLSAVVGITLGIISAVKQNTPIDHLSTGVALLGVSMPAFWLGMMLILVFSIYLKWTPVSDITGWKSWILPTITSSMAGMATITRMTRSSMLEVICQDYIVTARAKGLTERVIIVKHALKNALIPIIVAATLNVAGSITAAAALSFIDLGVQPEQKPAWQLARGMIESAMAAVKPGARACDIAEAMDARAAAQGRSGWVDRPGFAGSGMGWGRIDGPLLVRSNTFTLRAGMTLSLQASVRHSSVGLLILRQNVVVTEGGCAYLRGKTYDPLVI